MLYKLGAIILHYTFTATCQDIILVIVFARPDDVMDETISTFTVNKTIYIRLLWTAVMTWCMCSCMLLVLSYATNLFILQTAHIWANKGVVERVVLL